MDVRRTDHLFNLNDRELVRLLSWLHGYGATMILDEEDMDLATRLRAEHRRRADLRNGVQPIGSQFPRPEMQEIGRSPDEHIGPSEDWYCDCRGADGQKGAVLRGAHRTVCKVCGARPPWIAAPIQTDPSLELHGP